MLVTLPDRGCDDRPDGPPCDPPPPCLGAMEQDFGLSIRADAAPRWLADARENAPANQWITVSPAPGGEVFRVQFLRPMSLDWQGRQRFRLYQWVDPARLDTLEVEVRRQVVHCCPQWSVERIWRDGKVLCEGCSDKQPIVWDR